MLRLDTLLLRRPAQLSGGQRQRVALGRAIVRQPAVFLMDEPLSNLDAKLRVEMRGELARLHAELGVTTVYVTHDQVEAMTMGDRIVVMNGGRIEQVGKPLDLYRQPASVFVARFLGLPEINLISGNIESNGSNARFVSSDFDEPLSLPRGVPAGPILLGLRPQSLVGTRMEERPGAILLGEAEVVSVEHHGPESFAACRLGTLTLTAEISPASGIGIGNRVKVFADLSEVHLLDPRTERRIENT
jgi:sn-glycerol 3-phosphate transport system ATP-binding protein